MNISTNKTRIQNAQKMGVCRCRLTIWETWRRYNNIKSSKGGRHRWIFDLEPAFERRGRRCLRSLRELVWMKYGSAEEPFCGRCGGVSLVSCSSLNCSVDMIPMQYMWRIRSKSGHGSTWPQAPQRGCSARIWSSMFCHASPPTGCCCCCWCCWFGISSCSWTDWICGFEKTCLHTMQLTLLGGWWDMRWPVTCSFQSSGSSNDLSHSNIPAKIHLRANGFRVSSWSGKGAGRATTGPPSFWWRILGREE